MEINWKKWVGIVGIVFLFLVFLPILSLASSNVGNAIDDSVITGKIKASMAMNEITHATTITIETNDGIVTLKGTVDSETEATEAIEIAESTVGVKNVNVSQLYVHDSNQPFSDAYLTAKVKGIFLRNNLTPGKLKVPVMDVKVETQNGVVYLSGYVKNHAIREKLIALAGSVDGVNAVKSTLHIGGNA